MRLVQVDLNAFKVARAQFTSVNETTNGLVLTCKRFATSTHMSSYTIEKCHACLLAFLYSHAISDYN